MNLSRLKPHQCADRPQHGEDEDKTGDIETHQQLAERQQRAGAELADSEGNGAERADRRRPHDEADDPKKHLRRYFDQIGERLAGGAHPAQRESAEHRDEQNLKDIALAECADEGVRE